jgi:alanine-glyoxylate transaminase/serine-glyoxylate transaminase/serine-pyruvate transaminase
MPSTTEVLLLGPGPSPVSRDTLAAMSQPLLGHLDPEFLAVMDRVQTDLRRLFCTENPFTLPVSGTGSAGMEICLANLVEPGDRVVIGIHGVFGGRMKNLVERLGGEVVEVTAPFGEPLDADAMIAAVRGGPTRLVAFVHAETSTGVLIDPAPIAAAAREVGALCVLDCVTSLGGTRVDIDGWGVDAAFSGTQKCLSVPPGLSPVTFSNRALERIAARERQPSTWYLDVGLLSGYWGEERVYHHTAPVSMIFALQSGLQQLHEEGDEARFERHRHVAAALYRGLEVLGLGCLVPAAWRTPMLTTVALPSDLQNEAGLRAAIRSEHRIEVGGGLGPLKGRVWRIGLMGHGARESSVTRVLAAIGEVLAGSGRDVDVASALAAATG